MQLRSRKRRVGFVVVLGVLSVAALSATAQAWSWANRTTGTSGAFYSKMAVDAAGNTYVAGRFTGTITCGAQTLTSPGAGASNGLLVGKISSTGQWVWAKCAGRAGGNAWGNGVAVDRAGNVYVGGLLSAGTYTFDALPLTNTSIGCASYAFCGKLSATGQWQWVKGAATGSLVEDVVVDPTGNLCVVGTTRSLDPFGATVAPGPPYGNYAFASKLTAAGALLWSTAVLV